jgi:hypothetical protein
VRLAPFLLLLCGCSALVGASDPRIRCSVGPAGDPCPTGQRCVDGFCAGLGDGGFVCLDTETGCNGIDDDCDGNVDEGSDVDGDSFTYCNTDIRFRDCRDDNDMIHPEGPEIPAPVDVPCDGADNDCDGVATECPAGQVCDPQGACRVPDCSFSTPCPLGERCDLDTTPPSCVEELMDCMLPGMACTGGQICDPITRQCRDPGALGDGCAFDEQCGDGLFCVETQALEISSADVGGALKICSRACCTNDDCGADAHCWAPGTGARVCVPDAILALGSAGAPDDDQCSIGSQCSGQTCARRTEPGYDIADRETFSCGAPIGTSFYGQSCTTGANCAIGICIDFCYFDCNRECTIPCGRSSDCAFVDVCGWVELVNDDIVQACVAPGFGTAEAGDSCDFDAECRDEVCLRDAAGNGYCGGVCCDDSHCPDASYQCRPTRHPAAFWAMLCVRE